MQFLVKYLPAWFPGAGFKRFGNAAAGRINAVCELPFDMVKERQAKLVVGELQPSVTASFLQYPEITSEKEHALRWASEAVYAAGSDTVCLKNDATFTCYSLTLLVSDRLCHFDIRACYGSPP